MIDTCLTMPASRFFAMLNAGRYLKAIDLVNLCDIQYISAATPEWFKATRTRFENEMRYYFGKGEEKKDVAQQQNKSPLNKEEAKKLMFSLFAQKKRSMGYKV